ncbi:hypothetical protein [Mesorhizobium sp. YR577]|uniref:hypothetical protein n=1 Tax=Mesorhizobium sp. YR577 TaxID=1884373 RepID=UPI001586FF89|nr:hypothetical protein [Mesorhizobium sp. YR577]
MPPNVLVLNLFLGGRVFNKFIDSHTFRIMPNVPGHCADCDLVFDGAGGIHIENSSNVTIRGTSMTCPQCGRLAKLAEGTFNVHGDQFELVSGPPLTAEILARLRYIGERARAGEITPETAVREAKELDPVLGRLFERFMVLGMPALTALIALVGIYLQHQSIKLQKESLELQSQSLELQRQDSRASGDFYRDALQMLDQQTATLGQSIHSTEARKNPMAVRPKSNRRMEVNKKRREELLERRRVISPRRTRGAGS